MNANSLEWNEKRAQAMIGKRVFIGITRLAPLDHAAFGRNRPNADNVIDSKGFSQRALGMETRQMVGTIASIDRQSVEIELEGANAGETFRLPADLSAFHPAGPGEYLLRETGEVVVDPDFVSTWTIHKTVAH